MDDWTPDLTLNDKPRYLAIADAIAEDIRNGRLSGADRLPPQRKLAARLDVDFTTVARGYVEAQKRGLIESKVGQGTFVRAATQAERVPGPRRSMPVDLSMNLPPETDDPALIERMQAGLQEVSRDLVSLLRGRRPIRMRRRTGSVAAPWSLRRSVSSSRRVRIPPCSASAESWPSPATSFCPRR